MNLLKVLLIRFDKKVKYMDKFCYLGDKIGAAARTEEAVWARIGYALAKLRELAPVLASRGISLKVNGVYSLFKYNYGCKTPPMKS